MNSVFLPTSPLSPMASDMPSLALESTVSHGPNDGPGRQLPGLQEKSLDGLGGVSDNPTFVSDNPQILDSLSQNNVINSIVGNDEVELGGQSSTHSPPTNSTHEFRKSLKLETQCQNDFELSVENDNQRHLSINNLVTLKNLDKSLLTAKLFSDAMKTGFNSTSSLGRQSSREIIASKIGSEKNKHDTKTRCKIQYSGSAKKRKRVNSMKKGQNTPKKHQKKPKLIELFEKMKEKTKNKEEFEKKKRSMKI